MSLPSFLPRADALLLPVVNRLSEREPRAREALAAHAGKSFRLCLDAGGALQATIASDGTLQPCDAAIRPDVILRIPRERLREIPARWRDRGAQGVEDLVHVEGDAALAQLLARLAVMLRPDAEAVLARWTGDVLAVRLMGGLRALDGGLRASAVRVQQNLTEYLQEESALLVRAPDLQAWQASAQALATRLQALETRVRHLEQAC